MMSGKNIETFNRIVELLEEILKWTKLQGWQNVKDILLDTLNDERSKLVYHFSDGKSSREVAQLAGLSHPTVLDYWKKWAILGIVEPIRVRGGIRYKRTFLLSDFGIDVPEVTVEAKEIDEVKEVLEAMEERRDSGEQ